MILLSLYTSWLKGRRHNFICQLLLSSLLFLNGCAYLKPATSSSCQQQPLSTKSINCWSIQGKLGYKTKKESGSAYLTWQQDRQHYRIHLSGPLGSGAINIEGSDKTIRFQQAGQEAVASSDPKTLLLNQLGWEFPIHQLLYWMKGQPAPMNSEIPAHTKLIKNNKGLTTEISQSGWQLRYFRYTSKGLPTKIIAQNHHIKLTFIIKQWNSQQKGTKRLSF